MNEPTCFGYFDAGDPECTGGERSIDGQECERLGDCRVFKFYLADHSLGADKYLVERFVGGEAVAVTRCNDEQWENLLAGCRRAYGRKKDPGRPKKRKRRRALTSTEKVRALLGEQGLVKPLRSTTAKPVRRYQRVERVARLHERLWELTEHFFVKLLDESSLVLSDRRAAAVPGHLYFVNRWTTAGYVSLYVRSSTRHDKLVATVIPKPAAAALMVHCPFTEAELEAELGPELAKKLKFAERRKTSPQVKAVIAGVGREAAALLAGAIARLASRRLSTAGTVPSADR
jgi:hypothetical protein